MTKMGIIRNLGWRESRKAGVFGNPSVNNLALHCTNAKLTFPDGVAWQAQSCKLMRKYRSNLLVSFVWFCSFGRDVLAVFLPPQGPSVNSGICESENALSSQPDMQLL